MSTNALSKAIAICGSQGALAEKVGCKQQTVSHWLNKSKRVPAEFVLLIEKATNGAVKRHELRPDIFASPKRKVA